MNEHTDIPQRVRQVVAAVLGIDAAAITAESSAENVEGWDSLRQINIIFALEAELDVTFSDDEVANSSSVRALCQAIENTQRR